MNQRKGKKETKNGREKENIDLWILPYKHACFPIWQKKVKIDGRGECVRGRMGEDEMEAKGKMSFTCAIIINL